MNFSISFPPVSFLQFWLTVVVLIMFIFFYGLYMAIFVWHFGKPMRKYLKARLAPGMGIIQEYVLENTILHIAKVDNGTFIDTETKGYTTVEKSNIKPPREYYLICVLLMAIADITYSLLFGNNVYVLVIIPAIGFPATYLLSRQIYPATKKTYHEVEPVISKSTVSINGVDTLLLWTVTPQLPGRYTEALKALIKGNYANTEDIHDDIEKEIISSHDIIEGTKLTYAEFLELHKAVSEKYSICVTPADVLDFKNKYLDEHPRKSVIEKEVTKEKKRLGEHKYEKYAFILVGLTIVMGGLLLAYKLYRGGA